PIVRRSNLRPHALSKYRPIATQYQITAYFAHENQFGSLAPFSECNVMSRSRTLIHTCLLVLITGVPVVAQEKEWPAEYYRAHYLATVENDPAAALKIYETLAENASLPPHQRETIQSQLRDARERFVAKDLARLCPAESVAFVQIHRPGAL